MISGSQNLDPSALLGALEGYRKPSRGEMIGTILSSLAPVAASFNSRAAQDLASAQTQSFTSGLREKQQTRGTEAIAIMKLLKGEEDQTSDIKNFQFAKNQGYLGTFEQWQKENKAGGSSEIDLMLAPFIKQILQQMTKGAGGNKGSAKVDENLGTFDLSGNPIQ